MMKAIRLGEEKDEETETEKWIAQQVKEQEEANVVSSNVQIAAAR